MKGINISWKPKELIVYVLTVLASIAYIAVGHQVASAGERDYQGDQVDFMKARVVEILERHDRGSIIEGMGYQNGITIQFTAKILQGERRGEEVLALQTIDPMQPVPQKEVEAGDKLLLFRHQNMPENLGWIAGDYARFDSLMVLAVVFVVFLLAFGRLRGVNTLVSLTFTCLAVFLVFVPSILSGQNIYLSASVTCLFITVMTMLIVTGANTKSLAAGLGCLGGTLLVGVITAIMNVAMKMTGLLDEDSAFLWYMNEDNPIDLRAVIFGAILVGAIGAIMDVSVSIASALREVYDNAADEMGFWQLARSGFTIGRDVIGTMANTLVLAYIGSCLSVMLLLIAYNDSLLYLLNRELLVAEILQALAGICGILFALPFTSVVSALLYTRASRRPS